jgi:6-phospho-beta-glucosidase
VKELRLYDIDRDHLSVVSKLCARMAEAVGSPFAVHPVDSLVEAVADADAVLNSARPGGFQCRLVDETLPLEFGIPGQETVGPGGFFFALRSVPEALKLARAMERHAPRAVLLNYTNPTNIVTQALCEQSELRVLGLCDQSDEDLHALARASRRPATDLAFRSVGLNHATWYTDIVFDGERLASVPPELLLRDLDFDEEHRIRFELSLQMARSQPGSWPNSYLPYYLWPARFVEHSRRHGTRTAKILEKLDSYFQHFEEQAKMNRPQLVHHRGSSGFGDMAVEVLRALSSQRGREIVLNVPNRGMMADFESDTVVEARIRLSASGIERLDAPVLPTQSTGLLHRLQEYQRKTARAAARPDAVDQTDALASNPLVDSSSLARRMMLIARERYANAMSGAQ